MQWPHLISQVKNWLLFLTPCGTTCIINLFNIELKDAFRMKQCLYQKLCKLVMQIGSTILKIWVVKHSVLIFWPTLCI